MVFINIDNEGIEIYKLVQNDNSRHYRIYAKFKSISDRDYEFDWYR